MIYLKSAKKIVNVVGYKDLNRFISSIYSLDNFNVLENTGWPNDSVHIIDVSRSIDDAYDINELNIVLTNGIYEGVSTLRLILNDLCKKNLIDAGEYLIKVCW